MKPITIHPGSALAGAFVLGLVLFSVSATQESARQSSSQTTFTPVFPTATPIKVEVTNLSDIALDGPVQIDGQPHPRDFIRLVEATPLTVPLGRVLIITAVGTATLSGSPDANVHLRIDGVTETNVGNSQATGRSLEALPIGLRATGGQVVEVENVATNQDNGRAWGYLIDA